MSTKLKMEELGRLSVEEFKQSEKTGLTVVLDNIRSHHNVGSVFRTADAFAIEKIILCGFTPVPPHRDIHKTALGATESVDWSHAETTKAAVEELIVQGYKVWAIEQTRDAVSLMDFRCVANERLALVFGNEVGGVDQEIIDICHGVIEIPQSGTKHSINISVCAGIVMWEIFRQYAVK